MSKDEFGNLASEESIENAKKALAENGFTVFVAENGADAKEKVLSLIPQGASVMDMTSETLNAIGIPQEINESGKYVSLRNKLNSMDGETQVREKLELGAAPEWTVGSVHAVTEDGKIVVASNTGSQLPAYSYGSSHVIWVVGTQKIVEDLDDAMKRVYEYVLPLESVRVQKAYGMPNSFVSKLLIISREITPGRLTVVFVKEKLGF